MAESYQFDNPASLAYRYLDKYFPEKVALEEEPDDYDKSLLIIIKDGGGPGVYAYQLTEARLTFEVRSESIKEAAETASLVDALVREWENRQPGVYLKQQLSRPQYSPEADRRIPAYEWTVNFLFRGHKLAK